MVKCIVIKQKRKGKMRKLFSLLAAAGIAVIATGCASTHVSKKSADFQVSMKNVIATPEVVAGEKVSGEATIKTLFWFFDFGPNKYTDGVSLSTGFVTKGAARAAAYAACQKSGADMLLAPNYQYENKSYFGVWQITHCKVTGFKGVVKKITKVEVDEPKEDKAVSAMKYIELKDVKK